MLLIIVYGFVSSIVLVCGIGLERLIIFSRNKFDILYYTRNFLISLLSTTLIYLFSNIFAGRLLKFMPFCLIGLLALVDKLANNIFNDKSLAPLEKNFLVGISLFAFFEAYSLLSLITILSTGFLSLIICDILVKAFYLILKQRSANYYLKLIPLILVFLGLLTVVFSSYGFL